MNLVILNLNEKFEVENFDSESIVGTLGKLKCLNKVAILDQDRDIIYLLPGDTRGNLRLMVQAQTEDPDELYQKYPLRLIQ